MRPSLAFEPAPVAIAAAYVRAIYARDFHDAYRHLSTSDQRAWTETSYVNSQRARRGFGLRVARELVSYGAVRTVAQTENKRGVQLTIAFALPSMEDAGPWVLDWDEEKLNALTAPEQQRLLEALRERGRAGKLTLVQGQQSFDLIKEATGWKIFSDWAGGLRIKLKAVASADLETRIAQSEIIANATEPFQVNLIIGNRSRSPVTFNVAHRVAPAELIDQIQMIECGLSRPVTLDPGAQREFTMAYVVDGSVRQKTKAFEISYLLEAIGDPQ
jgi:hypothetical protein